jgi:hypothetical protein
VTAREAARNWVDVWSRAWPPGDVELVSTLYSNDALFYSHPFREHQPPRDYVTWAFGEQASAECRFGEPIVASDRAAVDWWAVMVAPDGSEESIAGTSLLRFGPDGLVVEQRDVWAVEPGRKPLRDWPR